MDNDTKKRLDKLRKELVRQQNSNNRVEGRASQDRAKKLLGIPDSKLGKDSDEEFWNSGNLRLEVKSGKQVSNTFSLFEKAETQSWDYEVSKDNPIQNISEKTKYSISSARSIAGPFKDKEDHVKISMESSGVTRVISSTNPAVDRESFLTPNSTRVMLEIKDFPYKNKNTDSKRFRWYTGRMPNVVI